MVAKVCLWGNSWLFITYCLQTADPQSIRARSHPWAKILTSWWSVGEGKMTPLWKIDEKSSQIKITFKYFPRQMKLKLTHHSKTYKEIKSKNDWGRLGEGTQLTSFKLPSTRMRLLTGISQQVMSFAAVSTMQIKQLRWKSFCIISWMTLSLDLVNKCSLSTSCVPSARITHNPGTQVDHSEAGRQKCEL